MHRWIITLVGLLAVGTPVAAQTATAWKTFTSPSGHFTVLMPGTPAEKTEPAPTGTGAPPHSVVLEDQGCTYSVAYTDLEAESLKNQDTAALLTSARENELKNVQGRLLSEHEIKVNGQPGREVDAEVSLNDKPGRVEYRIVLAKPRLYVVRLIGPTASLHPADKIAFLRSFHILPDEPNDGWQTFTSKEGGFSVRLPETPKEEVSDAGKGLKVHTFSVDRGDYAYILSYNSVPGGSPDPVDIPMLLNQGRDGALSKVNGKILEDKPITISNHTGKAVRIAVPNLKGTAYLRSCIAGDRYYQVLLLGTDISLQMAFPDRFLDSFRLTEAENGPPWTPYRSGAGRFIVDFPATVKQEKLPEGGIKYLSTLGGNFYIVYYLDLAEAPGSQEAITNLLQRVKNAEIKILEGKITAERPIRLGSSPGVEATADILNKNKPTGSKATERFFLVGKRLYQLALITTDPTPDPTASEAFFESFEVNP